MFMTQVDLELPGVLPLLVQRVQLSGYCKGRLFGRTWASTLDQRVEIDDDGIHFAADDGMVLHYPIPSQPGEQVMPSAGPRWPLTWDRRAELIEVRQPESGLTLLFPPGPVPTRFRPLAAVLDRNGSRITMVCDGGGIPTDVYHSGGYHLSVESIETRDGVRISALELADPNGGAGLPVRVFHYDLAGRLVEVIDSTGIPFVFEYGREDRVTAWVNRIGYRHEYAYDELGRVVRVGGQDGSLAAEFGYAPDERTTTVTDSFGHSTVYRYDQYGRVASVTDALGAVTVTEYDRFGRLLSSTDALGAQSRFTVDERGDTVRIEQPDGTAIVAEYNDAHQPTLVRAPDGGVWLSEYDERGNLTATTDPLGAVTRYDYAEHGGLARVTDALGNVTTIESDRAGLPATLTDPLGASVSVTRDAFGRVISTTDPLGASTALAWNGEGKQTGASYADGTSESWEYDADGNMIRYTDQAGFAMAFEYGPFRRVSARTERDGARYEFTHDAQLRLTKVTNPQHSGWAYEYDATGRLTAETDFNGRRLSYELDAAGRSARRVNAAGERVELVRDAMGRIVEQRGGDGRTATFAYDANGDLIWATNQDCSLELTRDPLGRVLAEKIGERTVANAYDVLGQRIFRTTPSGRGSRWSYSAGGWPSACAIDEREITFGHDAGGRETYRWLGADTALTQEWDQLGRLTARRILGVQGPSDARISQVLQERTWTYRSEGTPESISDSHDGTRRFALDAVGRVTAVSAEGWSEGYAYDAIGNLTHATDTRDLESDTSGPREFAGTLARRAGRTTYEYDSQGRLTKTVVRTLSGTSKVTAYSYDAHDRMTELVTADGQHWRYLYDPLGRRIAKLCLTQEGEVAEETLFAWDGLVLAEELHVRSGAQEVTATTWDYEFESWTPIAQDRRSYLAGAPQEVIDRQFHAIVTDLIGAPTELVTFDGAVAWRRSADLWGWSRPTLGEPGAPACPLRFPGQYHDDESGLDYNVHRYYDPQVARYSTADPLGLDPAPNHYGYAYNPLKGADPLGLNVFDDTQKYAEILRGKFSIRQLPTATSVVIDRATGVTYRGTSGEVPDRIHSLLKSRMDGPSLERWAQGNCAEFNAVNKALLKGAKIENLDYSTVTTIDGKYYPSCDNCKVAMAGANEVCG
jgi:RHS repeat-associated protein